MMSFTKNIQREIILLSKINYTLKDKYYISLMYVYLICVFIGFIYIYTETETLFERKISTKGWGEIRESNGK